LKIGLLILITLLLPFVFEEDISLIAFYSGENTTPKNFLPLENRFNEEKLEMNIFGYKVSPTDENPIQRDEEGNLLLTHNKKGFVDIKINSRFGNYTFWDLEIKQQIFYDLNDQKITRYEVEDPLQGFFSELRVISSILSVNLAFDNGVYQFNYDGILEIDNRVFNLNPLIPPEINRLEIDLSITDDINTDEIIECIKSFQQNSLVIDNKEYLETQNSQSPLASISFTDYALVHENWVKNDFWVDYADFSWLHTYLRDNTGIDIGVRRYHGYESQVKSDLQFYNKDYVEGGHGYVRNILAYQIVTHGGDDYGEDEWYLYTKVPVWWWWEWQQLGTITPSEIDNLWYHSYNPSTDIEIDVYPTDTIVFAMVCHGFYDNPDSMANAWDDNGAEAFISAIISIPVEGSDDFNFAFWEELCENGGTVEDSTIALCDYYNNHIGSGWNLGDEWRILGNEDATEP